MPDKPYQQKRSKYLKIKTLQHIDHFMSQNLRKKFVRTIKFEFSNQMGAFVTHLSIYCINSDNYQDSISSEGNDEYINRSFECGLKNTNNEFLKLFAAKLRNLKYGEQIHYRGSKVILNKNTFEDS
jgi:hypothetical protein